ncbi:hypothetical protein EDB19DRAFT_2034150 [Suillus lakei]|nr:hypothetical protein EDB19DRAFT_2034150 [Suillus lakei]
MRSLKRALQTSLPYHSPVMETIPRSSFTKLPTELVLLILKYAAQPTFAQPDQYNVKNPYSTARKICLVSKAARRIAMREMLHTVLLDSRNMTAFVQALYMQREYAQQQHPFEFAYTAHIRRLWIGEFCGCLTGALVHSITTSEPESSLDLIAPVLLGVPSLAIAFTSMNLLTCSVEHVWNLNIDRERSPPPWRTKTLTLSGMSAGPWHMPMLASGLAFLASITHLIALPDTRRDTFLHVLHRASGVIGSRDYNLPSCMSQVPWASFKSLESVSLVFPRVEPPIDELAYYCAGFDLRTELLTFPASFMMGHDVPFMIQASTKAGQRRILFDDVRVVVSSFPVHFCQYCQEWEKVWACGLEAERGGV